MSNNTQSSKRTRSQLALPDQILLLPLTRSPLKDARTAHRSHFQQPVLTPDRGSSRAIVNDASESDDEILLSPRKRAQSKYNRCANANSSSPPRLSTKRPSSPLEVEYTQTRAQTPGPDRKRARHDLLSNDIENNQRRVRHTPTRIFSAPSVSEASRSARHRAATPLSSSTDPILPFDIDMGDVEISRHGDSSAGRVPSNDLPHLDQMAVSPPPSRLESMHGVESNGGPSVETVANRDEEGGPIHVASNEPPADAEKRNEEPELPLISFASPPTAPANVPVTPLPSSSSRTPDTSMSPLTPLTETPSSVGSQKRRERSSLRNSILIEPQESMVEHNNVTEQAAPSTTNLQPVKPTSSQALHGSSNLPTAIASQHPRPGGPVPKTSIALAKVLGPKTAAKIVASSSEKRASIAELLGATVIPKTNVPVVPGQQKEKIKTKMRMRGKNNSSALSLTIGGKGGGSGGGGAGVVTRSLPVKKGKGKASSGSLNPKPVGSERPSNAVANNVAPTAGPSQVVQPTPKPTQKKIFPFSFAVPTASSTARTSANASSTTAAPSTSKAIPKPTAVPNSPMKISPAKPKSSSAIPSTSTTRPNTVSASTSNSNSNSNSSTAIWPTTGKPGVHAASPTKASLARAVSINLPASSPFKPKTRPTLLPTRGPSSLSTLASALEKLAMPPPARPNTGAPAPRPSTSMGFNRELDDGDQQEESANRLGRAVDDVVVGRSSSGGGTEMEVASSKGTIASGSEAVNDPEVVEITQSTSESTAVDSTSYGLAAASISSGSNATGKRVPGTIGRPLGTPGRKNSLKSWMVTGAPRSAERMKASGAMKQRMGVVGGHRGGLRGTGGLGKFGVGVGRVTQKVKVSRKTSLPSVADSPVKKCKPSGDGGEENEGVVGEEYERAGIVDVFMDVASGEIVGSIGADKGKEREKPVNAWKKNASLRASLASKALSQSLSSLPVPPPKPASGQMGPPETPAGKQGIRNTSSSHPDLSSSGNKATGSGSVTASGPHTGLRSSARLAMAGVRSAPGALSKIKGGEGGHVSGKKAAKGEGTLNVMNDCTVFVDVRTDDGDFAGDLFVQMLKGLGAKILTRVGQTCTHIVYKNGLMSTLTRYRLLNEPRPIVVGIAWVVECVEQRKCVDVEKFVVDLEGVNVAGCNKRRRSMLPKYIPKLVDSYSGEAGSSNTQQDGDQIMDSSIMIDDDLPPLEKARLRRMLV